MTKTTKKLYGVSVPKAKFETVKQLTDILSRETYTNVSLKFARARAVRVALHSLVVMNEKADCIDSLEGWLEG